MDELIATGAGDVYHAGEDCWALRAGLASGETQDHTLHEVHRFASAALAEAAGYRACGICLDSHGP
ncbi:hypothetical protein [Planotetraspora kaengkrachanensis]|uniref:Uncharacterized protein n=1 Tax=Planotetraspora kaengkrachanensis TaxID=575193 RepID=A0A8J3VBJ3_9ACTN|nr:hypothetical protein [Planotetraspora kaengkrachanensis]GIG84041.1 hypothetical protein Pka01_71680 [Planotetraspora kaengkrachanensis]